MILNAIDTDTYHFATAKWYHYQGNLVRRMGEYFRGHNVIIADHLTFSQEVGTVAHEATHHTYVNNAGDTVGGHTDAELEPDGVIGCIVGASDDEDDEDDDGGGGGGGGTGGGMWLWSPASFFGESCEDYNSGENEDAECVKVSGDHPDGSGDYYHCGGITTPDTVCWRDLVESGYWVWVEW